MAERIPGSMVAQAIERARFPWWMPRGSLGLDFDWFTYATDFTPLGASATATRVIQINADSAFMVLQAQMVLTDINDTVFFPNRPLLVSLSVGGASYILSNVPVHADNYFGTAERPKRWDVPRVLLPNTSFTVTIQNLEANARNVRVSFDGFKIWNFQR